jgi:REP element-mobilizing transposase RayT
MGYPPRLCFDGAIYHVTARGNNRAPIFLDDADYQRYLLLLSRYKRRWLFVLHAYALMPNHVHLIIQPGPAATISRIMQGLTISYTKHFNDRYERVGHVFQGRFHSRLIETEVYLLVASRYVHLNPVRAKLVRGAGHWAWSSYSAYQDPPHDPLRLVDPEGVLALASPDPLRQRSAYREFVEAPSRDQLAMVSATEPLLADGI